MKSNPSSSTAPQTDVVATWPFELSTAAVVINMPHATKSVARNLWHVPRNLWHMPQNLWHMPQNRWHVPRNQRHVPQKYDNNAPRLVVNATIITGMSATFVL